MYFLARLIERLLLRSGHKTAANGPGLLMIAFIVAVFVWGMVSWLPHYLTR